MKILALLLLTIALSACSPSYDDGWRHDAKFRPGDIVVFRLDGRTALVLGAQYRGGGHGFVYLVQDPKYRRQEREVSEIEIAKAPQRMCKDSQSTNDLLVYQEGDMAAEARCRRE